MRDSLLLVLIRKASTRADEMQTHGNTHRALAKLLRDEGMDLAAKQFDVLATMYATLANDIRETIKMMGIEREGEPS